MPLLETLAKAKAAAGPPGDGPVVPKAAGAGVEAILDDEENKPVEIEEEAESEAGEGKGEGPKRRRISKKGPPK